MGRRPRRLLTHLSQKAVRWMRWLGVLRQRCFINFMQNIPVPESWPLAWGYLIRQLPINYANTALENRSWLPEVLMVRADRRGRDWRKGKRENAVNTLRIHRIFSLS